MKTSFISQNLNNSNDNLFGTNNEIFEQDISFDTFKFKFYSCFSDNSSESENITNTNSFNNKLYFHTDNHHNIGDNSNNKKINNSDRFDFSRRKLKILVINNVFQFIREKIKGKYQLYKIAHKYKKELKIDEEKIFNQKTLGDILSSKISDKYSTIQDKDYNKKIIDKIKSYDGELKNIFDITFIKCLNHFIEKEKIDLLEGMNTFSQVKFEDEDEKEYIRYIGENYEDELDKRNSRNKK